MSALSEINEERRRAAVKVLRKHDHRQPQLDLIFDEDRALLRAEVVGLVAYIFEQLHTEGQLVGHDGEALEVLADHMIADADSDYYDEHMHEERPYPPWSPYA